MANICCYTVLLCIPLRVSCHGAKRSKQQQFKFKRARAKQSIWCPHSTNESLAGPPKWGSAEWKGQLFSQRLVYTTVR